MDGNAADTLDRIREGSTYIVAIAHQRLGEAQDALAEGDFQKCLRRSLEATARIKTLTNAEVNLSGWDALEIIRGRELSVGTKVYAWDEIEEIVDTWDDPTGDGDTVIVVKGKSTGDLKKFSGDSEVIAFNRE